MLVMFRFELNFMMLSYARAMIELRADVELKDTIVVFGHVLDEYPKKIISHVVKNLKNHRQAATGVPVGLRQEVGKGASSSSIGTTHIVERIDKLERQIIDGKFMLVEDDGKLLPKVGSTVNADSDSEVEEVFNETVCYMASTSLKSGSASGYGTKSLLEQWRETKRDDDYDPYDDNLYESYDMSENLQAICDDFDIKVRGLKKK
ncbi:hypothetical protein Tco_1133847 [Tanacetum coccineum]